MPPLFLALAVYGFLALVAEAARSGRPREIDPDSEPAPSRVRPPRPRRTVPPPALPVADDEPDEPTGDDGQGGDDE